MTTQTSTTNVLLPLTLTAAQRERAPRVIRDSLEIHEASIARHRARHAAELAEGRLVMSQRAFDDLEKEVARYDSDWYACTYRLYGSLGEAQLRDIIADARRSLAEVQADD